MQQKDYLLREIEKIGSILRAIRQRIFGGKENMSIIAEVQSREAKSMLLEGAGFDLDRFLTLNAEDSISYLAGFEGFDTCNIESLAEIIYLASLSNREDNNRIHQEKALLLYEFCNRRDKTYSIERETSIRGIKTALDNIV